MRTHSRSTRSPGPTCPCSAPVRPRRPGPRRRASPTPSLPRPNQLDAALDPAAAGSGPRRQPSAASRRPAAADPAAAPRRQPAEPPAPARRRSALAGADRWRGRPGAARASAGSAPPRCSSIATRSRRPPRRTSRTPPPRLARGNGSDTRLPGHRPGTAHRQGTLPRQGTEARRRPARATRCSRRSPAPVAPSPPPARSPTCWSGSAATRSSGPRCSAPDDDHLVTAGLFNLTDKVSAERARDRLRQLLDDRQGRFRGLHRRRRRRHRRAGHAPRRGSAGRSVATTWRTALVVRADGAAVKAGDAKVREILFDMIELHLSRGVLQRRADRRHGRRNRPRPPTRQQRRRSSDLPAD